MKFPKPRKCTCKKPIRDNIMLGGFTFKKKAGKKDHVYCHCQKCGGECS